MAGMRLALADRIEPAAADCRMADAISGVEHLGPALDELAWVRILGKGRDFNQAPVFNVRVKGSPMGEIWKYRPPCRHVPGPSPCDLRGSGCFAAPLLDTMAGNLMSRALVVQEWFVPGASFDRQRAA